MQVAGEEGIEPRQEHHDLRDVPEHGHDDVGRDHEQEPEEDRQSALLCRRRNLDVNRVARGTRERWERVRGDREVRVDVGQVAQVRGDEEVQPLGHAAHEDADQPGGEYREPHGDAPEREPDEVRDHEEDAKEHRQPAAVEIIGDDEVDRVRCRSVSHYNGKLLGHRCSLRGGPVPLRRR